MSAAKTHFRPAPASRSQRAARFRQAGVAAPEAPPGHRDLPAGWLAACYGKVAFTIPELARRAATRRGRVRQHYRCDWCGLWHVGSVRPRPAQQPDAGGRFRPPGAARLLDLQEAAWEAGGW